MRNLYALTSINISQIKLLAVVLYEKISTKQHNTYFTFYPIEKTKQRRTISVNRRPIRELSLKHRSAGISALDGLNRRSNSRVSLLLLSNLLDDSDIEKSSSEDESSSDNEDLIIENNLTFEDGLGLTFISKVVIDDQPMYLSFKVVQKYI